MEQRSTKGSESQSYQSKFKASDLEKSESQTSSPNDFSSTSNHIEDDKRKHHFESINESDDSTKNEHGRYVALKTLLINQMRRMKLTKFINQSTLTQKRLELMRRLKSTV